MAERTERTIINHLIETCRDAERGFLMAAEHVRDQETKRLFYQLAEQRHQFAEDLLPHAQRLGGAAETDGTRVAAAHRTWMQLRARLVSNSDRAVLAETARGERYAQAAYDEAVQEMLPLDARDLVEAQDFGVRVAGQLVAGLTAH
jgi:uncharacterized protein (TIGR02284 family)